MKKALYSLIHGVTIFFFIIFLAACSVSDTKEANVKLSYTLSMPEPSSQIFHVEMECSGMPIDTINLKMPQWMPGYYQIMNYYKGVSNVAISNSKGEEVKTENLNQNTWQAIISRNESFKLSYDVKATKRFVAHSFLDSSHAYIVPPSMFMYVDGYLNTPVQVKIEPSENWSGIATGLKKIEGGENEYFAPDFDILYDCPILIGELESLEPFYVNGVEHQFLGYKLGDFDKTGFMNYLQKIVESSVDIIGDIPYEDYKFIAIGPGFGGIEHLNNTTVSFDGNKLKNEYSFNGIMSFLAHEYFHHYNVKRIRPFELGPFNYDKGNKTNLLWVSEGLTVYYEYIVVKRAGVFDEKDFLSSLEFMINAYENDQGRYHQSLEESSFYTWEEGPFGNPAGEEDRSISYYEKGPVIGLILDFAIREATQNEKSLDDVMRFMYWKYYKELERGFTDAEFQQACETIAGTSITEVFEYVNTTKEIDYDKYLATAGLKLKKVTSGSGVKIYSIEKEENVLPEQLAVYYSWLGEK